RCPLILLSSCVSDALPSLCIPVCLMPSHPPRFTFQLYVLFILLFQVDLLRQKLSARHPHLEIKSVDGFQGREKEAVVLSLVRSNRKGEVGFLAENRRINVAVTRARRHIAVVCDTQTVQNHPFLKSLIDHITQFGEVQTAFEYLQDIVPQNYTRDRKDTKPKAAVKSTSSEQKVKNIPSSRTKPVKADPSGKEASSSKNHKPSTKEQNESRSSEIRKQLETFKNDKSLNEQHFPPSLNSHDRMLVHQMAEEMGLLHESRGEGKERSISVSKVKTQHTTAPAKEEEEEKRREEVEAKLEVPQTVVEKQSATDPATQTSIDLKSLHLERMKREQQKREENAKQKKQQNFTKKNKTSCEIAAASSSDTDFDTLISAVVKADSVCSFIKCKASVLTLGQLCMFCNRQYCLSHHIPEVHGCGDKAKSHARMRISKEGVLYAGSGKKDTSVDPNKKAYLQRKLDSKLKDMATQRKTKNKEKDGLRGLYKYVRVGGDKWQGTYVFITVILCEFKK
uniref:Uncharacterized protein n=1 Tax=Periophthalmus magnuspinnatus TaxID=409849 RepID=A0A3B4AUU4_9GOBI